MSGALLYIAIVVMWLCVLVPMWIGRDRTDLTEHEPVADSTTVPEADEQPAPAEETDSSPSVTSGTEDVPDPVPVETPPVTRPNSRRARARRRAVILARRRRRTFVCTLLVLASVITAAVRVIPWWGIAPSLVLITGHLTVLRAAVRVDAERRRQAAEARARHHRRERARRHAAHLAAQQAAQQVPDAEVIELSAHQHDPFFDQYAEPPRRAVGD
ncbi:divisome protein SepX/GlpR [Sinosporangium siamense]|uniref:Transmembrane protein n=1 Tax=Sinosporangium siamense TaxID=1367973 RepID=A0A919V946_9ACTN|nr:hypothetical protein [Sinosporangium siamense]GII94921.1 hypothetical protein Ssi02_51520 [Sinosporangium siamense]